MKSSLKSTVSSPKKASPKSRKRKALALVATAKDECQPVPGIDSAPPVTGQPSPVDPEPTHHRRPKIVIVNPMNGEMVRLFALVQGYCRIEDPTLLEILVQSVEDGQYYLQRKAEVRVEGETFSAYCQFGDIAVPGHKYRIIAVYGSRLEVKVFPEIPAGLVQSNPVTVERLV